MRLWRWEHAHGRTDEVRMRHSRSGHSLLEVIIATGIFILVAVALAGVWVMYGKALAKSSEVIAANTVARSITEGLSANGWEWLKAREPDSFPVSMDPVNIERVVRGRKANINYQVEYVLEFNSDHRFSPNVSNSHGEPVLFSTDICKISVTVRWHSAGGGKGNNGTEYNSDVVYSAFVYKHGI